MAVLETPGTLRKETVAGLRAMAEGGAGLAQMVQFAQAELGFGRPFVVPVLAYFCEAFSLPLRDVLPLREWCETGDPETEAQLLTLIRGSSGPRE